MSRLQRDESAARGALETLLQGNTLPDDELQALIAQEEEHTYLDFKSGEIKRDTVRDVVREYVAAFANGDGGILCIGPANKKDSATGRRPCHPLAAPSATTPVTDWLRDFLVDLAPYLSPLPRIIVQPYHDGSKTADVVLVAVARSPGLVPLYGKSKRPAWWVRFRDSNRELPEYLAADIILGRRNAPTLKLKNPWICQRAPNIQEITVILKSGRLSYRSIPSRPRNEPSVVSAAIRAVRAWQR